MSLSSGPLSNTSAHLIAVRLKGANRQIFRAFLRIASATLLIRVMGMVSQIVISGHFGAGATMDAYFVASGLPLLLASLLTSAIDGSVVPVYVRTRRKDQSSALFSTMLNLLLISIIVLTLILVFFRQQAIFLVAPALDPFRKELAISLTPVIFPVLLVMVVNGFLECLLNVEGQFGWPAYAGIMVPFTITLLVLVLGSTPGVVILCIGTLIGQCLQLGVLIVRAHRAGFAYRPVIHLRHPALALILIAALPELFDGLISQASPLVDQIFASFLTAGSISALSYSLKLVSVFSGVIFAATGQAALPYLSRQATIRDMHGFKATLRLYLWAVAIGTTILAAFVLVLAHPIVQILFQRGAFTAEDTDRTARTLMGFTIGLTPMAFGFIVSKAFSALRKNYVLLYVTIFSVFANALFDYIFARLWQSFGISLATSAVYFCTMFILLITLRYMIGPLNLFTPPNELKNLPETISTNQYYLWWISRKQELFRQVVRVVAILAVFMVGIIGTFFNAVYTLLIAVGSIFLLALLRYRYVLLIAWALIDVFIGSTVTFLQGDHLDTALTAATMVLMTCMPVGQTLKRLPALTLLLIYLAWVFASILIPTVGFSVFITQWLLYVDYVGVAILTINLITTRRRMVGLIDAILFISTVVAVYGLYGYVTKQNGIVDPLIPSIFRIESIFGQTPTAFAFFLSLVIPLGIYRAFTLSGLKRVVYLLVDLILLVACGLTFTRSAFISVPLSIITMIAFLPSRKMKIGLLSGAAVLVVLIVLIGFITNLPIFGRFFSQDIGTLNGRTLIWQALLSHFDPTKLLGNGYNASMILLSNLPVGTQVANAPHDLFIGTLYDHGVIGVILISLVLISLLISLIKGVRRVTGEHRIVFAMALAVFVNMFLQSLDSTEIWNQAVGIYLWIIMALPFALYWSASKQSSQNENEALDDIEPDPLMARVEQAKLEPVDYASPLEREMRQFS